MRYAIVSDIHANLQAWEAVLQDLKARKINCILCLGDVVGYGPQPKETLESVRKYCSNFVLGNHDAVVADRLDFSIFNDRAQHAIRWTWRQLPREAIQFFETVPLTMSGEDFLCVHAHPDDPESWDYIETSEDAEPALLNSKYKLVFLGHTHLPGVFTYNEKKNRVSHHAAHTFNMEKNERYLVNVGSVGDPRDGDPRASYCIYDSDEQEVEFYRVAFDHVAYKKKFAKTDFELEPLFLRLHAKQESAASDHKKKIRPARRPTSSPGAKRIQTDPAKIRKLQRDATRRKITVCFIILFGIMLSAAGIMLLQSEKETLAKAQENTEDPAAQQAPEATAEQEPAAAVPTRASTPGPTSAPESSKPEPEPEQGPLVFSTPTPKPTPIPILQNPKGLLSYEGFSYGKGSFTGIPGGSGWEGGWEPVSGEPPQSAGNRRSLRGTTVPLSTSGHHARVNETGKISRKLDTSKTGWYRQAGLLNGVSNVGATGSRLYLSVLMHPENPQSSGELALNRDSADEKDRVCGIGITNNGQTLALHGDARPLQIPTGTTGTLAVVVRIDFQEKDDDIRVYVNPPAGSEPEKAELDAAGYRSLSFDRITLQSQETGSTVRFDEIRIGTTYPSVATGVLPYSVIPDWEHPEWLPPVVAEAAANEHWPAALLELRKIRADHPELPFLETCADRLANVERTILDSFAKQIGQEITVKLRTGKSLLLLIEQVEGGQITTLLKRDGKEFRKKIGIQDLAIREHLERLGGDTPDVAWVYYGNLFLKNGNPLQAKNAFQRVKSRLGASLRKQAELEYSEFLYTKLITHINGFGILLDQPDEAHLLQHFQQNPLPKGRSQALRLSLRGFSSNHKDMPEEIESLIGKLEQLLK